MSSPQTIRELIEHLSQFDSDMKVKKGDRGEGASDIDNIDINNELNSEGERENVVVIW